MLPKILSNKKLLIFSILLVLSAVMFRNKFDYLYQMLKTFSIDPVDVHKPFVLTETDLAQYNGEEQKSLYLAVMGTIFDVTKGRKHYKKGATYNYFVGKDGSRALVTGKFNDESKQKDHVLDLSCDELSTVLNWKNTFKDRYTEVGKLQGRYYNHNGEETAYVDELNTKIERCNYEKELAKREEQMYPPCNIAWSQEQGTQVWCTATSGGVSRSWIGVPRQLFTPGQEKPHCVCINLYKDNSAVLLREYDNCPTSTSCFVDIS